MAKKDGSPSCHSKGKGSAKGLLAAVCLLSMSGSFPTVAAAATGNVGFVGTVTNNNQCSIIVANDGKFGISADKKILSSKLAGGLAAVAEVRSNHAYTISAVPVPTLVLYPTGGNTGVTLASTYSGVSIQNGRTFAEQPGTTGVVLRNGLSRTRLTINLAATRAGTAFPTGYYQGTVIIRCE